MTSGADDITEELLQQGGEEVINIFLKNVMHPIATIAIEWKDAIKISTKKNIDP